MGIKRILAWQKKYTYCEVSSFLAYLLFVVGKRFWKLDIAKYTMYLHVVSSELGFYIKVSFFVTLNLYKCILFNYVNIFSCLK